MLPTRRVNHNGVDRALEFVLVRMLRLHLHDMGWDVVVVSQISCDGEERDVDTNFGYHQ